MSYTVEFYPEHNKMPGISNKEAATNAALNMIEAIYNPVPTAPFTSIRDAKLQAISKLAYIFKQKTTPQKSRHKETAQTRLEIKHNNTTMKTASPRVKLPINLPTPAPTSRKVTKSPTPTSIVTRIRRTSKHH